MKGLGNPKYRSLLQLDHLHSYIMIYYVVYIQNILEKFIMDKSYPSITLMVVHSLDVEKDLLDQEMMEMRYWDSTFHMTLDRPNTIGWYLGISFDISKAWNILSWFFSSEKSEHQYHWLHGSDPHYQIIDKFSVPTWCGSRLMKSLRNRPHGYIHQPLSQR